MRQKRQARPELSIIIPAYKAQNFIYKNLLQVKKILDENYYDYEIICVVDGNTDKTFSEAKKVQKKYPELVRVFGYEKNLGKGHAVRFGFAKSKGEIVAFVDAGIELNPEGLSMLLAHFEWYDADIIIGSKRHPASRVVYPFIRKVMSFFYQIVVKLLFGLNVRDTQVGMKFFRREVIKKVAPRLLVKQFAFDIEILAVANYLGFTKIYEAPVELKMSFAGGSTIIGKKFLKIIFLMVWDTLAVFYRLRVLNYYSYKNRKQWITPKYLTLKD